MVMMCDYSVIMITLQENKLFSRENFVQNSLENPFRRIFDEQIRWFYFFGKQKKMSEFLRA